jgi:hypothetical protein
MKIILGLFFLCLHQNAHALPASNDLSLIQKLMQMREQTDIAQQNSRIERIQRSSIPHEELNFQKILDSGLHYITIPKGHMVINFRDNYQIAAPKALIVEAYRQADNNYVYLKGKSEEILYKVHINSTEPLDRITDRYPEPKTFTALAPRQTTSEFDEEFRLNHQFLIGFDQTASDFAANSLNETTALAGNSQRYGYNLSTQWDAPINIGLGTYFENTSFEPGLYDSIMMRTLAVGILVKSRELYWRSHRFEIGTMFSSSVNSRLTSRFQGGLEALKLKQNAAQIFIEYKRANFIGDYSIGLSFRKIWNQLEETKGQSLITDLNASDNSVGFYLTQAFTSKW